jgi:VWFA-related protein
MQRLPLIPIQFRAFSAWRRCGTYSQAVGLGFYISRRWRLEDAFKSFCPTAIKLAGITWILLLPITLTAQTGSTVPTQTQPVSVSLIVTDKSNRSVKNLRLEHIQITEAGQPIKLTSLEKDDRPLRCVIALDMSGSFRKMTGVSANVARLLIETKRLQDEFSIVTFVSSDKIETLSNFTASDADLLNSLKLLRIEGGQSAIIDAVYLAVQAAAKRSGNHGVRGVVVLLTDGEDRASFYKEEQLVKLLQAQCAVVYPRIRQRSRQGQRPNPRHQCTG